MHVYILYTPSWVGIGLVNHQSTFIYACILHVNFCVTGALNPQQGSWGHVVTLEGFIHHFRRADYGTFQLFSGSSGKSAEGFWERNSAYLKDIMYEQGLQVIPSLAAVAILTWLTIKPLPLTGAHLAESKPVSSSTGEATKVVPVVSGSSGGKQPAGQVISVVNDDSKSKHSASKDPVKGRRAKAPTVAATATTTLNAKSLQSAAPAAPATHEVISPTEAAWTPVALLITQLFYFGVFHSLANLPMKDKLLFGVHQRFWMQPNVLLFMWAGIGFHQTTRALYMVLEITFNPLPRKDQLSNDSVAKKYMFRKALLVFAVVCASLVVAVYLVTKQYTKWYAVSDQSQAFHFRNYAKAVLEPLPKKSILLINYDQQWTSVR